MSLLSEIGIIGSGVLGALYAISKKEKSEMELAIASVRSECPPSLPFCGWLHLDGCCR